MVSQVKNNDKQQLSYISPFYDVFLKKGLVV